MDDSESRGFMFKYEKLFRAGALSEVDVRNVKEGKGTLDRTRRLLYVTASRARKSLALLPQAIRDTVLRNG
jgi:DNA helicase-2/ATP-dependent DNA helicase PcrA